MKPVWTSLYRVEAYLPRVLVYFYRERELRMTVRWYCYKGRMHALSSAAAAAAAASRGVIVNLSASDTYTAVMR